MTELSSLSNHELLQLKDRLYDQYASYKAQNLKLDMSRGKPSGKQLDLSGGLLNILTGNDYRDACNTDCRNYGGIDGLPEAKQLFADLLDISDKQVIVGGNSSLTMMFDNVASNMTHGVRDGQPWATQGKVKFLCPSPGYDRHFAICDYFHIEMIPIPIAESGPDMDEVERLVANDPMIKGIWCVPKYSNPDGITYSDQTVYRFANLKPAAKDFRIYWDNAYCIHTLTDSVAKIPEIIAECEKAGNPNMPLVFTSFSKVSFSGAAIACMASSESNIEYIKTRLSIQTIGPDKLNQLRHIRFFKDAAGVLNHMKKHAAILRPKFNAVLEALDTELKPLGIAHWQVPQGGYFISVYLKNGCAKRVVGLCRSAGVILTPAGATYPYGHDPGDSNIRIAPTFPPENELKTAMALFCLCAKIAAVETIIAE